MSSNKKAAPQCMPHRVGAEAYARDNNISQDILEKWWALSLEYGWNPPYAKFKTWRESLDNFAEFNAKLTDQSNCNIVSDKQETVKDCARSSAAPRFGKSFRNMLVKDGEPMVSVTFPISAVTDMFRRSDEEFAKMMQQWILEKICEKVTQPQENSQEAEKPKDEKIPGTFTQWEVCEMAPGSSGNVKMSVMHDWKEVAGRNYDGLASQGKIVRMYEVLRTPCMATRHPENNIFPPEIKSIEGEAK